MLFFSRDRYLIVPNLRRSANYQESPSLISSLDLSIILHDEEADPGGGML